MKNFILLFFFIIFTNLSAQEFSVTTKRALQLYKDAEMLVNYNKDYARAVFVLNALIKEEPTFVEAYLFLGDIYGQVLRHSSQKKMYLKVLKLIPSDPRHVTMYYRLGVLYQNEGNYEEAIKFFKKVEDYPLASKTITQKSFESKQECEKSMYKSQDTLIKIANE